jgi:hypothetical protein
VDLEVIPKWHFFAYCTLLGCLKDVPQARLGNEDSQEEDIEPKGNDVLDIHDDSPIIAYLQAGEIPIKLAIKKQDQVVHKAKQFKWESDSLLRMWIYG